MDFRTYSKPRSLFLRQQTVLTHCYEAQHLIHKIKGLLGTQKLALHEGVLLPQCQSVHTFFMRYPIDICFLTRQLQVLRVIHGLRPWRITGWIWQAYYTLETAAGWNRHCHVQVGDVLRWDEGKT